MSEQPEPSDFQALAARQLFWSRVVASLAGIGAVLLLAMLIAMAWFPRSLILAAGVPAIALCVIGIAWAHRRGVRYQMRALDHLERSQQAVHASLVRVMEPLGQLQDRLKR